DCESGVDFPDLEKISAAYGLPFFRIRENSELARQISAALAYKSPCVCEIMADPQQDFEPKLSSRALPDGRMVSAPLEDMAPFLERAEFLSNMIIPPLKES
ncbi:MAG: hypothetical protein PHW69_01760, partial [Elusimicrobiaceae bacterium]|nr:hypothetical protein [Elusimicrobiaceae bacterium]